MKPKEDPAEKAERARQRRLAAAERRRATQDTSESLTTDYRSVYGSRSLFGSE